MSGYTVVEVWVMVDENGDYVIHKEQDRLKEQYEENVGELDTQLATRMVRVTVNVPTPKVAEVIAVAPDEAPVGELKVA